MSTTICAQEQLSIFCGSLDIQLSRDTYVRSHWSTVKSGDNGSYYLIISRSRDIVQDMKIAIDYKCLWLELHFCTLTVEVACL